MAELRHYKENENRVHEQLYDNLFLLSQIYPTSKDFNAVFKRDMFVKNNKAAFFEVVYYLLNTLDATLTNLKITTWPPYEIRRENKFRAEVLKYINELNTLYDNADIPHIMSSHLITPGGFKFAKFMLKLSQLIVYEHLKKTEEFDILYCLKPARNVNITKVNINNVKRKTNVIENQTKDAIKKYEEFHFQLNERALSIDKELNELNSSIREAKQKNVEVIKEFNKSYASYPSFKSIEEKISALKEEWDNLQEVQNMFIECDKLLSYLNSSELILEHCKDKLKIPNEVLHIIQNHDELDLNDFFYALSVLLDRIALELPNPTNSFINDNAEKVKDLNEKYFKLHDFLTENVEKLHVLIKKISIEIKGLVILVECDEVEEILALPLTESDKSE